MAVIGGIKTNDLTGNGFSPDDAPLAGVVVELFQDDGDQVFDPSVDTLLATAVTQGGTGAYQFADVADGLYYVREQVPAGFVQTGGPPFYTIEVTGGLVFSGGVLIDDFDAPSPGEVFVIDFFDPDPTLIKTADSSIVGGERDALVDVLGQASPISALGVVGFDGQAGVLSLGTAAPGTSVTLQYDGLDADIVGPPAALVNAEGLSLDLTGGGAATALRLDFESLEMGLGTQFFVEARLTGPGGETASFSGVVPEDLDPFTFLIDFADFTTSAGFSFTDVTSIEVELNPNNIPDVDLILDRISTVRQGGSFDFANFAQTPSKRSLFASAAAPSYVEYLYERVLGRAPAAGELATWNQALSGGLSAAAVASAFLNSPERKAREIEQLYQDYLGRSVDAAGLAAWLAAWQDDGGLDLVRLGILTSDEYVQAQGGTDQAWVAALYGDLLGRAAGPGEVAPWIGVIETAGRAGVVRAILGSDEFAARSVATFYQQYLGRPVDESGLSSWLGLIKGGVAIERVRLFILASAEARLVAG